MPKDLQEIISAAAGYCHSWSLSKSEAQNGPALARLRSEHGVEVLPLPTEILDALAKASKDVLREVANTDSDSLKILSDYTEFQKTIASWYSVSEGAAYRA